MKTVKVLNKIMQKQECYEKAELGDPIAFFNLGLLYEFVKGVNEN